MIKQQIYQGEYKPNMNEPVSEYFSEVTVKAQCLSPPMKRSGEN